MGGLAERSVVTTTASWVSERLLSGRGQSSGAEESGHNWPFKVSLNTCLSEETSGGANVKTELLFFIIRTNDRARHKHRIRMKL